MGRSEGQHKTLVENQAKVLRVKAYGHTDRASVLDLRLQVQSLTNKPKMVVRDLPPDLHWEPDVGSRASRTGAEAHLMTVGPRYQTEVYCCPPSAFDCLLRTVGDDTANVEGLARLLGRSQSRPPMHVWS